MTVMTKTCCIAILAALFALAIFPDSSRAADKPPLAVPGKVIYENKLDPAAAAPL